MSRARTKRRNTSKRARGRPRQLNAKRRTTTRQGRRTGHDPVDRGTAELRAKRRRISGGHETLPHDDPLSAMYGRYQLSTAQYMAGRQIGDLLAVLERERLGSVWHWIITGARGGFYSPEPSPQAEWAMRILARIGSHIGQDAGLVFAVCGGAWWPLRHPSIIEVGLDRVAQYWAPAKMDLSDARKYYLSPPADRPIAT